MEKQVRMQAARWLAEQEMMPQALLQPGDTPSESELAALAEYGCGVLSGSGDIVAACAGLDPRAVFLSADAPEDALRAAHGRCRYLAQTPEELQKLDALGYSNLYDLGGILSWPYEIEGDFEGHF